MSGGYDCQFCDGERAVEWIVTNLKSGATFSVCGEDFSPAMINVVAVDLGVDPTKFYESIQRFVARQAKDAAKETEKATSGAGSPDRTAADGGATLADYGGHDADDLEREETGMFHGSGEEAL